YFDAPFLCNTLGGEDGCYFDQVGLPGIDVNETGGDSDNHPDIDSLYRFGMNDREENVDTFISNDLVRDKFPGAGPGQNGEILDYDVTEVAAGDWLNYTRTLPEGRYSVYLRASSESTQVVGLSQVRDATSANQTSEPLGTFNMNRSPGYQYTQLTDATGARPLSLTFSGVTTFRLTAVEASNDLHLNYLAFVPVKAGPGVGTFVGGLSPSADQFGVFPDSPMRVTLVNDNSELDSDQVSVMLDGADVTKQSLVSMTSNGVDVWYQPEGFLSAGAHHASISYQDTTSASTEFSWSFTVADLPVLPGAFGTPIGTGTGTGFLVRSAQGGADEGLANDTQRAEDQLAGDPVPLFEGTDMPTVINYNQSEDGNSGLFRSDNEYPDKGLESSGLISLVHNDMVSMEIIGYLELSKGIHTFGVNSDDGFRMTAGRLATDNTVELGVFNGGRGDNQTAPQSLFSFVVEEDGLYATRLIWYEGTGGASVELYSQDRTGSNRRLINDPGESGAIQSFTGRTEEPKVIVTEPAKLTITEGDGRVEIHWDNGGTLQSAPSVQGPWENMEDASSPHSIEIQGTRFFKVIP
ncbi:hypothetical protein OAK97_02920, partial [bacterium]|nr:hypothetical protein [bacterium]